MSKYRFKTKEEFILDKLWDEKNNCPIFWSSLGEMNEYLGADVPDIFNVYCDKNTSFTYGEWHFKSNEYVLKEQQEYFPDLSQHIGRYIRALVDNPNSGSRVRKGDIGKIISSNRADFPNFKSYSCNNALTETHLGTKYELLPEDYSPEQEIKNPSIEFIPDKWYNFTTMKGKYNLYAKVDFFTDKELYFKDGRYISNKSYDHAISIDIEDIENPRLVEDLSEIQDFLPDGHPDKVKNFKPEVGKWYSFNWDWFGKDRTVIAKIKGVREDNFIISWRSYLWKDEDYNNEDSYKFKDISNIKELSIEEVQSYLPNGHPDKITNQKFEIGKWYKWYQKNHENYHYGKVKRIEIGTDTLVMTPWIIQCNDYNYSGTFDLSKSEQIQEISIEQIQEFLPYNHPDKFCETCNGEGETMVGKLYPSGHTEVTDTCPDCNGTGFTNNVNKITSSEFKKGEYIVLIDGGQSTTSARLVQDSNQFIKNYCYKVRENNTFLRIELDPNGSTTNGWECIPYNPNQFHKTRNWRYATQEEIDEYERRGKPYDVVELNKQSFPDEGSIEIEYIPKNLMSYLENNNRKSGSGDSSYNKEKVVIAWNKSFFWFCSVGSSKPKYSKDFIEKIIGKSIYLNTILEAKKELSMKEIQEECKRRFPIGCTFIAVGSCMHRILKEDSCTYKIVDKRIWAHDNVGCLYKNGKWAELVSLPKQNDLKEEAIKYSEETNATILLESDIKSKELHSTYGNTSLSVKLLSNKTTHLINNVREISSVNLKIK